MNDQMSGKENVNQEQTDNMSANEADMNAENNTDDIIAQALNTDDSVPGTLHLGDTMEEGGETGKLKEELADMKDKYIRLVAEFDNFRRRTAKERNEQALTAGKDVIQSLLVVLDDTDRAAKQIEASEDVQQIKEGVSLVFNKLRSTLQGMGLKKMESIHQEFDTDLHEAITEIPAGPEMEGKIIDEIEPGYYLNDRLIRHAKVIVGK